MEAIGTPKPPCTGRPRVAAEWGDIVYNVAVALAAFAAGLFAAFTATVVERRLPKAARLWGASVAQLAT